MEKTRALKLASEAYEASQTYFESNIRPQIDAALRQFNNRHPTGSKYLSDSYKGRSKLFRPKTRTMIRKNEATAAQAYFSTADVVNIAPSDENSIPQRIGAAIMGELMEHRLTHSIKWFMTAMGAYQDAQTVGVVVSKQYWHYDKAKKIDKPCIDLIPVENFRFDAAANWVDPIGTSPYLVVPKPMYVYQVKAKMASKEEGKKWFPLDDAQILTAITKSGDSTRLTRSSPRADPKEQPTAISDYMIVWVHENCIDMDGEDWVYYTLGDQFLLSTPKPRDEIYMIDERPFVMGQCVIETHKTYPSGLPALTKDLQAEINEVANQRLDNVKFVLNKRYFVKRGRQVDLRSLVRNVPSSVTLMTDPKEDGDVRIVSTPDVTGSSYQEQDRLNVDFDDLGGLFSQASVQTNRNLNETVGGMNKIDANATIVNDYQLRIFNETWAEPVLRQIMKLEKAAENDEQLIDLCAQRADVYKKYKIGEVNDKILEQDFILSVNVGIGSTNPETQLERFVFAVDTIVRWFGANVIQNMESEEVIGEIFGKVGYKNSDRFFSFESDDPRIGMLQSQLQGLQDALNAKEAPEVIAAKVEKLRAEVENIKADTTNKRVTSVYSATQAAGTIAPNAALAPMSDSILKSSGFEDQDDAPIVPEPAQSMPVGPMPTNTNPLTPAHPDVGMTAGIETTQMPGQGA